MTEWEKKLRQEVCDEYCPDDDCSHRKKEEKCLFNKDIRDLVKREIKEFDDELFCPIDGGFNIINRSNKLRKERGIE